MSFLSNESLVSKNISGRSSQVAKDHARPSHDGEPTHKGKNRMFYYKYCPSYGTQNTSNFKQLLSKYEIVTDTLRTVDIPSNLTL
ncbi:hypothetical protein B0H67DRAFT_571079 [Lasiosphaeris hirsuta]|uniref:Uncharacterized protein n=1 Tax=Lasiosphaeris hirsuta TaxID=260670 RepID=A0AA40B0Y5_9PEZI|nr:hypothetical protein B0H67DRAFT_571079 [Lasiosphaeris hirsuta]